MIRRRWLAGSLVEELTLRNPHPLPVSVHLELEVAADFAHVFDVKSGIQRRGAGQAGGRLARPVDAALARTTIRTAPRSCCNRSRTTSTCCAVRRGGA